MLHHISGFGDAGRQATLPENNDSLTSLTHCNDLCIKVWGSVEYGWAVIGQAIWFGANA